jgi:hypothetical protein
MFVSGAGAGDRATGRETPENGSAPRGENSRVTEQTESHPPRNWYPDPELPGHLRWWDGAAWQQRVPMPEAQPQPGLGAGFRARSAGLQVLLATSALTSVAMAVLYSWGRTSLADELEAGRYGSSSRYDNLDLALTMLDLLLLVATMVCWCLWQHRLARSLPPGELRRSPGMHAGSWFIPVVCLWFPLQNMRDLWDACRPARGRAVLGWWWAFWIVSTILSRWADSVGEVSDIGDFRSYNTAWLAVSLVWVVTSVLALYVVATLTRAALAREEQALPAVTGSGDVSSSER